MKMTTRATNKIRRVIKGRPEISTPKPLHPRDSRTDQVHLYSALLEIAEVFGGLTNAALRRTNTFIEHGNVLSASILVFTPTFTAKELRSRLTADRQLHEAAIIRVLWDDLRGMSDDELRTVFTGNTPESDLPAPAGTEMIVTKNHVKYFDDFGKLARQEHRRDDGGIVLTHIVGSNRRDRLILHQADGQPILEWDSFGDLNRQWTESVITDEPSVLISDGASISSQIQGIRRRNFKLIHLVHVSHLKPTANGVNGEMIAGRLDAFRNHDQFDIVAVQTQRQIDDMAKRGLSAKRMRLLPSEIAPEAIKSPQNPERDENQGIVVARLVGLKQVDHAINSVHTAKATTPQITLDICGDGRQFEPLETLIDELDLATDVNLLGHVDNVADRLSRASFSLITSKHEGLGLSIIESMAAGCIPIAYDFKYGPSDIITNGVNGYIVPANDAEALASAIVKFVSLSPGDRLAMRESAVERARHFLPEASYSRWKAVLEEPVPTQEAIPFRDSSFARVREMAITTGKDSTKLAIVFADVENIDNKDLRLVFASRTKNTFFQTMSTREGWQRTDGRLTYNFSVPNELFSQSNKQTFDIYVRKYMASWDSKARLRIPAHSAHTEAHSLRWFRTKYGNFSVRVLEAQPPATT